jgi:hypothetical protein
MITELEKRIRDWEKIRILHGILLSNVADPDADPNPDTLDPYVFGPPGSGSISQRYGSGSFYHQAKIVRKP